MQTNLRSLERTADQLLTKEMFILFQSYVFRTIKLRVIDCKEMVMFSVYMVLKYCSGSVWHVSYCPPTVHFSCCCMRMQSIGLPCDHILAVLVCLNFMELPSSLVCEGLEWKGMGKKRNVHREEDQDPSILQPKLVSWSLALPVRSTAKTRRNGL